MSEKVFMSPAATRVAALVPFAAVPAAAQDG
jgi:hypothetical protein